MIEPAAYLISQEPLSSASWVIKDKPIDVDNKQITPLYTESQFRVRVVMNKEEFGKWERLYKKFNGLKFKLILEELEENFEYYGFYKRFAWDNERISIFAKLFFDYDTENPEKTIEIVDEGKWVVRSNNKTPAGMYWWLVEEKANNYVPEYLLDNKPPRSAKVFDTKEKADEWVTPITKAVNFSDES